MLTTTSTLKSQVMQRIAENPTSKVWTPRDFLDLGGRDAIDKTLQRLVISHHLRRINRGLYDQLQINPLSGKPTAPDYQSIIDAVGRRDQIRVMPDGMTAANDLGLTNAVPGQVIVHTDGRLHPIMIGNLTVQFKLTAPSKLYWAGHPAMRIVQALYWLRQELKSNTPPDQNVIRNKLIRLLNGPGADSIRNDLMSGLHTLPVWMQKWVRDLLTH
jgi:hypothetical protein